MSSTDKKANSAAPARPAAPPLSGMSAAAAKPTPSSSGRQAAPLPTRSIEFKGERFALAGGEVNFAECLAWLRQKEDRRFVFPVQPTPLQVGDSDDEGELAENSACSPPVRSRSR